MNTLFFVVRVNVGFFVNDVGTLNIVGGNWLFLQEQCYYIAKNFHVDYVVEWKHDR